MTRQFRHNIPWPSPVNARMLAAPIPGVKTTVCRTTAAPLPRSNLGAKWLCAQVEARYPISKSQNIGVAVSWVFQ